MTSFAIFSLLGRIDRQNAAAGVQFDGLVVERVDFPMRIVAGLGGYVGVQPPQLPGSIVTDLRPGPGRLGRASVD